MGFITLVVGRLDDEMDADVVDAIGETEAGWRRAPRDVAELCLLNIASLGAFLEHVATLGGVASLGEAAERFPSLPWGMPCAWVPDDIGVVEPQSELYLVADVSLLTRDLEEIRDLSPLALGRSPAGYADMRADVRAFMRGTDVIPGEDVVPWIWRGLSDGAAIALEHDAPLLCE